MPVTLGLQKAMRKSLKRHADSAIGSPRLFWAVGLCLLAALVLFLAQPRNEFRWPLTEESSAMAACGLHHFGPGTKSEHFKERMAVYDGMQKDFEAKGAAFLKGDGETSQSLKLGELFEVKDGAVKPVLKKADPAVRATVLHLDPVVAVPFGEVVEDILRPHFEAEGVWYQAREMMHMSMVHASHHITPVLASPEEVDAEAAAVERVAMGTCPLRISLDRILLTSTGVLLGCWQLLDGTDPADLRDSLRAALLRAPTNQLYNRVMLHTSFARILAPPRLPSGRVASSPEAALPILRTLVEDLNKRLCTAQAKVEELWYVEEFDVLALAVNGSMRQRRLKLGCSKG